MFNADIFSERNESQNRIIKQLEKMGYTYVSRSESDAKRGSLSKVLYEDELAKFLAKQTYTYRGVEYHFSSESINKAIKALDASLIQGLMMASKEIYNSLCDGISLPESISLEGNNLGEQSFDLNYIDWDNIDNNTWQVTEEFSVEGANGRYSRPDIVLLCNGIPFCVIECKSACVSVDEGVKQNVRNMMPDHIPQLFKFAQIVIAANPDKVKYGTTGTTTKYFVEWREQNIEWQNEKLKDCIEGSSYSTQDRAIVSLLDKKRVLDIIRYFILYHYNVKKIARYQQFFAVNKAMDRILGKDKSNSRNGVIWHTQGSGKSLTMVMLVKKIQNCKEILNPRFLIVTDRINLDKQIKDNFANAAMAPVRATTGKGLKKLLENEKYIVITTLINKFEYALKSKSVVVDSENFFVFVDEAHRSQYSAMHNYMKELLPHATYIGFTGTPLISKQSANKNANSATKSETLKQFGEFIDTYTMKRGIEDGITVPLIYEGRKVVQNDPTKQIDIYFESMTKDLGENEKRDLKQKYSRFKYLAETDDRLNLIAWDISEHFLSYCAPKGLKAITVCSSRAAAVYMYNVLSQVDGINPAVIISYGAKDENEDISNNTDDQKRILDYKKKHIEPYFGANTDLYESTMTERFKSKDDEINMLIVKDKLLTGFDAPIAGVLYVDKSMQQHNLLQAIARVNRVYEGKDVGLIVDYYGLFKKLNSAIDVYDDLESGFDAFDRSNNDLDGAIFGPIDEKNELEKSYQDLVNLFDGVKDINDTNELKEYLSDIDEEHNKRRANFYEKLKKFGKRLDLAFSNRSIFVAVGYKKLDEYKKGYQFFNNLKNNIAKIYGDVGDFSKYEDSIRKLLNTFVHCEGVAEIVKPFNVSNKKERDEFLHGMDNKSKADAIRTRVLSELSMRRYEDPLKFEKFSELIKKTLAQYQLDRDADAYLNEMERIADDAKEGRTTSDYPIIIRNNSDAKAFFGTIVANFKEEFRGVVNDNFEYLAEKSLEINEIIKDSAKRDWHFDNVVHKEIRSKLDLVLFQVFEQIGIDFNIEDNINMLDIIEDELMKVAIRRY